jgi:hypothetical protein
MDQGEDAIRIRLALKRAERVLALIVQGESGVPATASLAGATFTAACTGTLGNRFKLVSAAQPDTTYTVRLLLGAEELLRYEGLNTIGDLMAASAGNPWIVVTGDEDEPLTETAGLPCTGGTNATVTGDTVVAALAALDGQRFDVLCVPSNDTAVQQATLAKVKQMRDSNGVPVRVAMPNFSADYAPLTNVTNGFSDIDGEHSASIACAWAAGGRAACTAAQDLTHSVVEGATGIVDAKADQDAAILAGEFFFGRDAAGNVVSYYDINSLTTFTDGQDERFRKNRVLSVFDELTTRLQLAFPPGKFTNSSADISAREGLGTQLLLQMQEEGVITNVDEENDFVVDRVNSHDDQTYITIGIQPLDSVAKTYIDAVVQ